MRPRDLLDRLNARPFNPFRVHLDDGTLIDITQPKMVVGRTSAVLPTAWENDGDGRMLATRWRTVSLDHIVRFGEVEPGSGPVRR